MFEYQISEIKDFPPTKGISKQLNELGRDGWEVILINPIPGYGSHSALMKRVLTEQKPVPSKKP